MRIGRHNVGSLGLGTAQFAFRPDLSAEQSITAISAAVEAGVRLIDTALAYTHEDKPAYAETLVRRALLRTTNKDEVLVATKGGHYRAGNTFPIDARPETLRAHCDASLIALGVQRIGLYQLHWIDPSVPLTESVGALKDQQQEGKIEMIGLSNVDLAQLEEARALTPIASVQNRLSIDRPEDLPVAKACAAAGITYLAYMPLGGSRGVRPHTRSACEAVAKRHNVSWQQVALAWLLLQPGIVPIVGASRRKTIIDSLRAQDLCLLEEDLALLPPF